MHSFLLPIVIGIVMGLMTRVLLIQSSYRQFPSRPHGLIIHVFLGFVASLLGALVIPAIFKPDFTAGVFVSIGSAQFHTMRDLERQAWLNLDNGEPIPRGASYIEGMATTFEARIFLVLGVSAMTTLLSHLFGWSIGLACGLLLAVGIRLWRQGKSVADIAEVSLSTVDVDSGDVMVDGKKAAGLSLQIEGTNEDDILSADDLVALAIVPKDTSGILTLAHHGQQQAILHNLAMAVGVRNHPKFSPVVSYHPKDQKLTVVIAPIWMDKDAALAAVAGAPILEGVYRRRLEPQHG